MLKSISASDVRVHGHTQYMQQKYEVLDQVGKGGHGLIMTTRDLTSNRVLVCKSVPKTNQRVKQELASMVRVHGTVKVHDFYEDQDNYYIIMDKGWKDVHSTHVEPYLIPNEEEVQKIISSVLKTLAQSHSKGILHLDIKAGNLLWMDESQKQLALIDWGLSLNLPKGTEHAEMRECSGTPWFMAPEQLSSQASSKSDIWAVGVLCAQLLTKKLPFNDKSNPYAPAVSAIWRSILMDTINTKSSTWKHVSDEARHFVEWLLSKDPESRPSALEALQHPWLCRHATSMEGRDIWQARKQRYEALDTFQRICIQTVATNLREDPIVFSSSVGKTLRNTYDARKEVQKLFYSIQHNKRDAIEIDDVISICEKNNAYNDKIWVYDTIRESLLHSGLFPMNLEAFEEFVLKDPELPLYVFTSIEKN